MNKFVCVFYLLNIFTIFGNETISPYKFTDSQIKQAKEAGFGDYVVPESCRFTLPGNKPGMPQIVFYLSKPSKDNNYPIAILCGGSVSKDSISSIIHVHRYFLQECLDLNMGTVTVELRGIDGAKIDESWINYYTRSQRLADHSMVIEHLKQNPPAGWNGKLVLIGVSEGGPLVTSLSTKYAIDILATINWSGADGISWREELWSFIQAAKENLPWWAKICLKLPNWMKIDLGVPKSREAYDQKLCEILNDPCSTEKCFLGMTYKYHADALCYPEFEYSKIVKPFLVVAGAQNSSIVSSDCFVQQAQAAGANITYLRVADMDHYVRKRPDVIVQSFEWLKENLY